MPRHRPWLTAFQRCCFALLLVPGMTAVAIADRRQGRRRYDFRDEGGRAASGTAAESNAWSSCRTQLRRGAATVPDHDGGTLATAAQRKSRARPASRCASPPPRASPEFEGARARRQIRFRLSELAVVPGSAEIPRLPRARARRAAAPGIIVVRQDGPQSLAEPGGKTLAFPSPRAFGATLLTRADLRRLAIPHDVKYLGTTNRSTRPWPRSDTWPAAACCVPSTAGRARACASCTPRRR